MERLVLTPEFDGPSSDVPSIFPASAAFDPAGDFDAFLKAVPARWVVYLVCDVEGRPVQLLCVRNLRNSLKRRLGVAEAVGPSRRIDYRALVRHVYWRRVDSEFEADWLYFEAARAVFPHSYQAMIGFRPAWFVHVDPDAAFPRYTKGVQLHRRDGTYLGPLEDKASAAKMIQLAEDSFDLCRYHETLTQAPAGRACAYKEMGKCPAPCDGTISLEQYRRLVEWSAETIVAPESLIREQTRRMEQAAAELRFESAGRIKAFLAGVSQWGKGPFRHARRLEQFQFLSLQRGPGAGSAKVFLITPGRIEWVATLIDEPAGAAQASASLEGLRSVLGRATVSLPLDEVGAGRIAVVSHHLFLARRAGGVFLRLDEVDERALAKAYRELQKQSAKEYAKGSDGLRTGGGEDGGAEDGSDDDEGLMKELQALPE